MAPVSTSLDFMRYGPAQEDEVHSGGNPRWLIATDLTMPAYKLNYFDVRGRGEVIRLTFVCAGVEFEDNRVSFEDWPALKPSEFASSRLATVHTAICAPCQVVRTRVQMAAWMGKSHEKFVVPSSGPRE
ncbi:glutathione s-transferase [Elysia marginata]|uniref:glutathione transferase n=1 Tax=Elysia marginata TaxID=1093978 RepID=A0AAV4FM34_9GAST|nr:glutathione s-transferase [Elysia marginata]